MRHTEASDPRSLDVQIAATLARARALTGVGTRRPTRPARPSARRSQPAESDTAGQAVPSLPLAEVVRQQRVVCEQLRRQIAAAEASSRELCARLQQRRVARNELTQQLDALAFQTDRLRQRRHETEQSSDRERARLRAVMAERVDVTLSVLEAREVLERMSAKLKARR